MCVHVVMDHGCDNVKCTKYLLPSNEWIRDSASAVWQGAEANSSIMNEL